MYSRVCSYNSIPEGDKGSTNPWSVAIALFENLCVLHGTCTPAFKSTNSKASKLEFRIPEVYN